MRTAQRRRGSTLVLVLWTLVIVGGIALSASRKARSAVNVATNARAAVVARYAAESGIAAVVRAIEDSLKTVPDSSTRGQLLHAITQPPYPFARRLGDSRFDVAVEDVNAKLDLNYSTVESVAQLLSEFGDAGMAQRTATAIRAHIGTGVTPDSPDESFPIGQLDSPGRRRPASTGGAKYITSLDELMAIPEVDQQLVERAAPVLTVDGDGTTNRVTAPGPVLRAARGALIDMPSRLLIVSRGWLEGSSLTHEIQAVYAVQGDDLALVRWRERTR